MTDLACYNKGCGKRFIPEENKEDACQFHPGVPVFHDALKGWSCCKKRSTDFTEFLNIPGCSRGFHSNEKPLSETEKPKVEQDKNEVVEVKIRKPIEKVDPLLRPSENEAMVLLTAVVAPSLKQALEKQMTDLTLKESQTDTNEKESTEITVGTACKNNACKGTYKNDFSNLETCLYHPGVPIFHEGMKYWSCCQRKTSEFDTFLSQEGCTEGKHLWFKKVDPKKIAACRYDWHQTAQFVIISVFARVAQPEETWVEANQVACKLHITYGGGNLFNKHIILKGVVDPTKSDVKLLGTKVEIKLRKAEPGSWSDLELPQVSNKKSNDSDSDSIDEFE